MTCLVYKALTDILYRLPLCGRGTRTPPTSRGCCEEEMSRHTRSTKKLGTVNKPHCLGVFQAPPLSTSETKLRFHIYQITRSVMSVSSGSRNQICGCFSSRAQCLAKKSTGMFGKEISQVKQTGDPWFQPAASHVFRISFPPAH